MKLVLEKSMGCDYYFVSEELVQTARCPARPQTEAVVCVSVSTCVCMAICLGYTKKGNEDNNFEVKIVVIIKNSPQVRV